MKSLLIQDEVYERLKFLKKSSESFSGALARLLSTSMSAASIDELAGGLSKETAESILKSHKKWRSRDYAL